jgi:glycosyltransferase involved in cell wall biosynthesis
MMVIMENSYLFYLALLGSFAFLYKTIFFIRGIRVIQQLTSVAPLTKNDHAPKVSIIVTACNEARSIEAAVNTLLEINYPDFEIIVINDRSTDDTAEILDRVVKKNQHLMVIHNSALPEDFLGKCHAMHLGSEIATGEYFLFTDGDVMLHKETLNHAIAAIQKDDLDHLPVSPEIIVSSRFLDMMIHCFAFLFFHHIMPWLFEKPGNKVAIGIGAFNLVKATTYRASGGHKAIAMRPDDDLMLGKNMKLHGARGKFYLGENFIQVAWYHTLKEMVIGLEKNIFAGFNYSLIMALGGASLLGLLFIVCPIMLLFTTGKLFYTLCVINLYWLYTHFHFAIHHKTPKYYGLLMPLTTATFIFIILRSTLLTLKQGGIYWRGTFYDLKKLKANKI